MSSPQAPRVTGLALALLSASLALPGNAAPSPRIDVPSGATQQLLADLAAVIECRPTQTTEATLRARLLAGGQRDGGSADDEAVELTLPAEINVFGARTDKVMLDARGIGAVLEGRSIQEVVAANRLTPHYYPDFEDTWIRPVAVRNDASGWIKQRALSAMVDDPRPGDVRVGCVTLSDGRKQQRERAGEEVPLWYAADANVIAVAAALLSCRGNRQAAITLSTSLLMKGPPDMPFTGWVDESSQQYLQWKLPQPLQLDGASTDIVRSHDNVLMGVLDGVPAEALAVRWGLEEWRNEGGDTFFQADLAPVVAKDGWEEHRRRMVIPLEDGTTLAGCSYTETTREQGWWPGDPVVHGNANSQAGKERTR